VKAARPAPPATYGAAPLESITRERVERPSSTFRVRAAQCRHKLDALCRQREFHPFLVESPPSHFTLAWPALASSSSRVLRDSSSERAVLARSLR
jgi:hypothetical protein